MQTYKGWTIQIDEAAPITGRVKAYRHGVRIGAGTVGLVRSMIDVRNASEHTLQTFAVGAL